MVEETGAIRCKDKTHRYVSTPALPPLGPFASFEFEFSLAPKHSSYVMFFNYLVFAKNSLPAHK